MKIFSVISSIVLSIAYIITFYLNVGDWVTKHIDLEFSIPLYLLIIAVIVFIALFIVNKARGISKIYFLVPTIFSLSAIITMIIGAATPCPFCTV